MLKTRRLGSLPSWPLLAAFCVLLWIDSSPAKGDDALLQRFRSEANAAWEAYNAHQFTIRGSITQEQSKNGQLEYKLHWIKKEKPSHRLAHADTVTANTYPLMVYASNSEYIFTLTRPDSNSPWIAKEIQAVSKDPANPFAYPEVYKPYIGNPVQNALLRAGPTDVRELVRSTHFKATRAEAVQVNGADLVRIHFDNEHPIKEQPFVALQSGWLLLDPKHSWCVRGFELREKFANSDVVDRSEAIELRESSNEAFPLPVRIVRARTHHATDGSIVNVNATTTFVADYQLEDVSRVPDEEFWLTAFGLPEPAFVKRPTRWYVWALLASGVCFVAYLAVRRRAAKSKPI